MISPKLNDHLVLIVHLVISPSAPFFPRFTPKRKKLGPKEQVDNRGSLYCFEFLPPTLGYGHLLGEATGWEYLGLDKQVPQGILNLGSSHRSPQRR